MENQSPAQVFQMPSTNPGQQYQTPAQALGQSYPMPPPNPGQAYPNPMPNPGPTHQMPTGQLNQLPSGQPNQIPPGQPNQMAPGRQLNSVPSTSPGQPYEAQPMIPGQSLQTSGSSSSQQYQTAMPTPNQAYQMPPQNTSQTYQVPPTNPASVGSHQGMMSKPASALYQTPASGQPYQVPVSHPGQPYQTLTSNPEQAYQGPSSNPGQLHADTRSLPGQPMPVPPQRASQAYPTPASATGQPYQVPVQMPAHQPYQAPPQSPNQGPPQPTGQVYFKAPGQAGYQSYQNPGQPPGQAYQGQIQHPDIKPYQLDNIQNKTPMPASVGASAPQHQQQQHVMPPSPMPQPLGVPPPNHYPYQPNYYTPPQAQNMPGNRVLKQENQGNVPYPVAGQPLQTLSANMAQGHSQQPTDGRAPSYTLPTPPQATHWTPPFASPVPSSVSGHMTSPYQGTQPVSFGSAQSMTQQPQSQNPPSGYHAGPYPSSAGYAIPGQQPVLPSRQPYVQSPSQAYGHNYNQPVDPRSQYVARRSPSSDAKINSIDILLCHAEELEPRVLAFSGRRGQLNFSLFTFLALRTTSQSTMDTEKDGSCTFYSNCLTLYLTQPIGT